MISGGACPLAGLTDGQVARWPTYIARGLVAFMVVSGAPAVFGLFAVRDIWKLRAKIAPENESAFECDAGVKMSKFEAPIDVIGRRGSLNRGIMKVLMVNGSPEVEGAIRRQRLPRLAPRLKATASNGRCFSWALLPCVIALVAASAPNSIARAYLMTTWSTS